MTGIELIAQERRHQIEDCLRTIKSDVYFNNHYQLSQAAMALCYIDDEEVQAFYKEDEILPYFDHMCPSDWELDFFNHMMRKSYEERLIIAGALIAAEIDRLQNQ